MLCASKMLRLPASRLNSGEATVRGSPQSTMEASGLNLRFSFALKLKPWRQASASLMSGGERELRRGGSATYDLNSDGAS